MLFENRVDRLARKIDMKDRTFGLDHQVHLAVVPFGPMPECCVNERISLDIADRDEKRPARISQRVIAPENLVQGVSDFLRPKTLLLVWRELFCGILRGARDGGHRG